MSDAAIRSARPQDSTAIVSVIRSGFTSEILGATIYGSRGIALFIENQIALPKSTANTTWTVMAGSTRAGHLGRAIGCVELRHYQRSLSLNYISVLPSYRATGVGRSILRAAIETHRRASQVEMTLDVLSDNVVANRWYERLGFKEKGRSEWWDVDHPAFLSCAATSADTRLGIISGYPQACASHRNFGFSQFTVATAGGEYSVGCLGKRWFRVTQAEALVDSELGGTLRRLGGKQRFLAILPADALPEAVRGRARQIASTVRKAVMLDALLRTL